MADNRNSERDANGLVSTPMSIRNVGTEEWNAVNPELVECTNTGRGTLTLAERARLAAKASSSFGAIRKLLLDEVGD